MFCYEFLSTFPSLSAFVTSTWYVLVIAAICLHIFLTVSFFAHLFFYTCNLCYTLVNSHFNEKKKKKKNYHVISLCLREPIKFKPTHMHALD